MLVFLGQGLHLFLLRHIHDLGLDPCWWRTKELWFRSTSQIHFNGNGTDLHNKKKKDIYLRLHKKPHPTPSALFGLTIEMYQHANMSLCLFCCKALVQQMAASHQQKSTSP